MVIDSSDRERLSVAKDELYKMLNHEVSAVSLVTHIYILTTYYHSNIYAHFL